MENVTTGKPSVWRRYLPIILSVSIGVAVSFVLYYLVQQWEQQKIQANFKKAAEDRAFAIQRALAHKQDLLQTVDAFMQANSEDLTRTRFKSFVDPFMQRYPGIQAVEWIPRIPLTQRGEFEARAQQTFSNPEFRITELNQEGNIVPAGERPEYYPFFYIEPLKGNELALGFDVAADKERREVLMTAAETGEMRAISHLTLIQETASLHGLLMFLPIYEKGSSIETPSQRMEALHGFVLGVFQVGEILDDAMRYLDPRPIDIRVFDESPDVGEEPQFLYFHAGQLDSEILAEMDEEELEPDPAAEPAMQVTKTFLVAGRTWSVDCTPAPGYHLTTGSGWQALTVLLLGLLITIFLAIYFYNAMRHAYLMAEVSESANQAQSKFLANMSHELRTPLNAIVGYSELLQEEAVDLDDPTLLQDVEKIYISGKYLLSLTDGILDLSKIKAGKVELHTETCKISHVIEEVVSIVTPLVKKNNNNLTVNYQDDLGTMQTDVTRLHQILFNLLNNATESTEQGEIRLDVAREHLDNKEWIRFAISDSGPGMTAEQRNWLTQVLSRGADEDKSADEEEIGFGLAISSHFWRMMNGKMEVKSEPDKGSTFILRLPAHP